MKRFLRFSECLSKTEKRAVGNVYNSLVGDCRSTIGTNFRLLQLACNSTSVKTKDMEKQSFFAIPKGEEWRQGIVEDLINTRDNIKNLKDWKKEEVIDALHHVCVT